MSDEIRFSYGRLGMCLGFALIVAVAAFVVWGLTVGNQKGGALLLAVICAPGTIAWLRMPIVFTVSSGRINVRNLWGRSQSWPIADIVVQDADRSFFRNTLRQETTITDRSGEVLFRLYPFKGLNQLVELLAPGSAAAADRRRKKSWWNRELL